jgi:H+/Cl- antiporter ClcA
MMVIALVGVATLVINYWASWSVLRNPEYSLQHRRKQLLLIWLVPLLGAAVCLLFVSAARARARTLADDIAADINEKDSGMAS